jgi:hypothetical protein
MSYISIHPDYLIKEGFATLMSHYALIYCIHKDCNIIPAILDINFDNKNIHTTMKFFNKNFDQRILYHKDVFLNFDSIFEFLPEDKIKHIKWHYMNLSNLSYENILLYINNHYNIDIMCHWNIHHDLIIKYIDDIINILFKFKNSFINECRTLLPITDKEIVGISVRTEYKNSTHPHKYLEYEYYYNAIKHFNPNSIFLIFSDNIAECSDLFKDLELKYNIQYTNPMMSATGLCLLSMCDHIINTNSSFSYWASLLNKNTNKKIICHPEFIDYKKNPRLAQYINYKWYPKNWTAII